MKILPILTLIVASAFVFGCSKSEPDDNLPIPRGEANVDGPMPLTTASSNRAKKAGVEPPAERYVPPGGSVHNTGAGIMTRPGVAH